MLQLTSNLFDKLNAALDGENFYDLRVFHGTTDFRFEVSRNLDFEWIIVGVSSKEN